MKDINKKYISLDDILARKYLSDLTTLIDNEVKSELSEMIRTYSIKELSNKSKIMRNFIIHGIKTGWNNRILHGNKHPTGSLNKFIAMYGESVGKKLFDGSNIKRKNKSKETHYRDTSHMLSMGPFKEFVPNLTEHSIAQIGKLIEKYDKSFLVNRRKEMIQNLLRYNVDGDWIERIEKSNDFGRDGFSIESCKVRYGNEIGAKIFCERREKVLIKKEDYPEEEWREICEKRRSNLGEVGYIEKYGEKEGTLKWNEYLEKWKTGIEQRKKTGVWKNGLSLEEFQERYGQEDGYSRWKSRIEKRKYSLSLQGYIDKLGEEIGKERWNKYCRDQERTSLSSFISRYGEIIGKEKYNQMREKICKYINNSPFHSRISQELFSMVAENLKNKDEIRYATYNGEQYFFVGEDFCQGGMCVDFKYGNCIIEFYGDFWHANPLLYESSSILRHPMNHRRAEEIWEHDELRTNWLRDKGYFVLTIWESDFIVDKIKTAELCIAFINKHYERT